MEIAAALLAGAAAFFAGFCLGTFPPVKSKIPVKPGAAVASENKFFENFLNYDGGIQP